MELSLVLRPRSQQIPGLAPAGILRDQQAEKRRALGRATADTLSDASVINPTRKLDWVNLPRGAATPLYSSIAAVTKLLVVPKAKVTAPAPAASRKARIAALARWHRGSTTINADIAAAVVAPGMREGTRFVRRGEFDLLGGTYRNYTTCDLLAKVRQVQSKELKWTELDKLYEDGSIRVPPSAIRKVLYPKGSADEKIKQLVDKGLPTLGAPRAMLTKEQENFGLGLALELAIQHKPISPSELMRWAAVLATKNGTRTDPQDQRAWHDGFVSRARIEHGIDLLKVDPQQVSRQRAAVMVSGMRNFAGMIGALLDEEPLLKAEGLIATGNWDEMKWDLNKILTEGQSLVPAGMEPRWEVPGERAEQMTLLAGYMGYRPSAIDDRPRSLADVRARIADGTLESFGEVAGYPKIPPGYWDGPDFCVLVGLLVFKGKTGADPAWLNFVQDKSRLMVCTTESGHINTQLKYEWYHKCKELYFCPFGKRPTIPNADSHASNESVEMSAEMELEDDSHLVAPPGHSSHITQQLDQSGGPIKHTKSIATNLVRHGYRIGGALQKARIAQEVELAMTLGFTPATCSSATTHVGWGEDAHGNLTYDPLSKPHIVARLFDDESASGVDIPTAVTAATTAPAVPRGPMSPPLTAGAAALAAFRSGAMDGEAGIAAGREAAQAVLGRGSGPKDGWANEEDMEDEVIPVEGSRARRNALPNGRIVGQQQFRDQKAANRLSVTEAAATEELRVFKSRRMSERILNENTVAEGKIASGSALTQGQMVAFIRARTDKPVSLKGDGLVTEFERLHDKPIVIRIGLEPDAYADWLFRVQTEEAAKKMAKETGTLALMPPATPEAEPAPVAAPVLLLQEPTVGVEESCDARPKRARRH